ncbi:MAG: GNAT family N-acetyltransferase [Bacteriovoracaceae bacterium]|nr:GNAT family N-acetyltransferase [Bacteroidota bacterium]
MIVRRTERQDFETIRSIVTATGVFSEEEIGIAVELMEIYLNDPNQKDYELFSYIDSDEKVLGYICIGPTPATTATYDLYWIAVDPATHSKGIGTVLLNYTEDVLRQRGGRLLIAETSSTSKYDNTRQFYERKKFQKLAHIKEYYKPNDDLVIYGKYL